MGDSNIIILIELFVALWTRDHFVFFLTELDVSINAILMKDVTTEYNFGNGLFEAEILLTH